jgi:hypothetical protein
MPTFLALNAAAVGVALLAALAAGAARPASRLLLATASGYLVAVYLTTLLTGLVGRLSPAGLLIALAAALALAGWLAGRGVARRRTITSTEIVAHRPVTPAGVAAILVASAAGVAGVWPHLAQATRLWVWDDYTYHMVYPALWLREHGIAAPEPAETFTMQAWYPLGASVVAAWFMAPFVEVRAEALAWVSLAGPLYGAIFAAGAAEILARLGCRAGAWAVPVVLFATSDRVTIMAGAFSDADLAQAAALFGAFAFALPRRSGADDTGADAWYAALLTGFALAVKVSALPVALVILTMVLVRAAGGRAVRGAIRVALVFALAWIVMAGYWYGRNVVHTGNPVYPAASLWGPGTTFPETTLREYSRQYGLARTVTDALAVYLNWPRLHALLAVLGLTGLALRLLLRGSAPGRPARAFGLGTLAIVAVVLLLLPLTPFSAGNAMTFRSGFIHWDSMRYVAVLPFLGWVALAYLLAAPAAAMPAGAPGVTAVTSSGMTRRARHASGVYGVLAGALIVGALIAGLHTRKAAATAAWIHAEPLFGAAAAVLDAQPAGTRVAVFGDQWIYPAFGARHHLRPVRLDGDGRVAAGPIGDAMGPGDPGVDPATFRANLRAAGIGVVVVVHQPHPGRAATFPGQYRALQAAGDARLLHQDRAVAVFRVGR